MTRFVLNEFLIREKSLLIDFEFLKMLEFWY